jgi:hypothetical protein
MASTEQRLSTQATKHLRPDWNRLAVFSGTLALLSLLLGQSAALADCACVVGYPYTSSNPRTSVAFNESTVLKGFSTNLVGLTDTVKVWYNDEHALVLGVRRVIVNTASGSTTNDYPLSVLSTSPSAVTNPLVGTTALSGDQAGTDLSERPMFPALFITDTTGNSTNKAGDWQFGGTPIPPHAVFGSWKSAVRTLDQTKSPPVVTITTDADPAKNDWKLGGGDPAPAGLQDEGYGAEVRWNVADLGLQPDHTYRLYFMVHDGDQNNTGGDVGQACINIAVVNAVGPDSQTNCPGSTVTFSTAPSGGGGPYSFRWLRNGSLLSGQTNSSLTLTNISATQAGTYTVIISGFCGSLTNSGTLTVYTNVGATPLTSLTRCAGDSATFATTVSGTGPYGYAWLKNGSLLAGQTGSALTLTNLSAADAGTYSVVVTGACGALTNNASLSVNPVAIPPPDITVDCLALAPPPATNQQQFIAQGGAVSASCCGAPTTISWLGDAGNGGAGCPASPLIVTRTYLATTGCGGSAQVTQTLTLRDATRPSLTCPPNLVLECPSDTSTNATGVAVAQDGCGRVTVRCTDTVSNSCGGTKVIARAWTATDACGNSTNCVQMITLRDTTPPSLITPPNLTLECPAGTGTNATGVATALDTCGQASVSYLDSVTNGCGGSLVISRAWTARDECGNSTNRVQTITLRDTTKPTVTCPPNRTLECPADTSTNATGVATAQDACSAVTLNYRDSVTNSCGATRLILRTWTATDVCGNSNSSVQTITVRDTTPPTLICPSNVVLECPATNTGTNLTGVATAQDGCGAVTVSYSDVVSTNCGGAKTIARTWTATDACGNTTNCVQTITVRDTTRPAITCPPNRTLECPADTRTNVTGVATALDTCSSVSISFSDSVSNSCGGAKVILRTWTATDACGNGSNALQTITVRDTTPPAITTPPNLTLECGAATTTNATGAATALDGCGPVTVSFSDSISNNCGSAMMIVRTWTATDQCSNWVSALQTITVRDTTPPALRLPASLVLQCPGDTRTNVTGAATATDACGSVTISYSDVVSNGCGLTRTVLRRWTATDQCGNATNGVQTIAVVDTTKPAITCPNISVQCLGDVPAAYSNLAAFLAGGGTATDSCSSTLTFSLMSDSGLVGRCPATLTRVYRVTDVCGNFGEAAQTITLDDTIPPVLSCASNVSVECGASLDPASIGIATATDNCATNVSVTYSDAVVQGQYSLNFYVADPDSGTGPYSPTYLKFAPASLPCPDTAGLTGRALDPLRNAVAYAPGGQLDALTSIGNVPMAFGQIVPFEVVIQASGGPGPERGTIEFTADWSTYTTSNNRFGYDTNYMVYCAFVDAADPGSIDPNNNARVESYSSTIINPGTITEAIEGTFRISGLDAGDRVVVEIWVVLDSNMPDHTGGTVAAGLVSAQKASNPPVPITVGVQTDSLGNLSKITALPPPQAQPPLGPLPPQPPVPPGVAVNMIDRTWTATDDCANQSTCVQRITVRDTTPPVIRVPDVVLDCPAADTSTNVAGVPLVQDCSPVRVYYSDIVSHGCANTKVVYRTWSATDGAGLTTNVVQTITVRDATRPTISCPPDIVLECPADTRTNATGVASAQDACSQVTLGYSDAVSNSCGGAYVITRTWTAADACGNSTNAVQTITVRDTTRPTISCPPDMVLECPADTRTNATGVASAEDACSQVTLGYSDTVSNSCSASYVITRTWTATDACGNSASCVQTITVQDTTPPTLAVEPYRTMLAGQAWSFDEPAATDSCGAVTLRVLNTVTNMTGPDSFVAACTWQAVDACGNSATCRQTITVLPAPPPVLELLRLGPGRLRLRWSALASNYRLEAADRLVQSRWEPVSATPVSGNGFNYVELTANSTRQFYRLSQAPPSLEVGLAKSGALVLRWPMLPPGFLLEATANLTSPNWSLLSASPVATNGWNTVELPPTARQRFYRLRKPVP